MIAREETREKTRKEIREKTGKKIITLILADSSPTRNEMAEGLCISQNGVGGADSAALVTRVLKRISEKNPRFKRVGETKGTYYIWENV